MKPHRSFWLQEVAGDAPTANPLQGKLETDILIVGGGYVGLWTALNLKKQDPAGKVTLIEGDICGGGASGRNGGFALSYWTKFSSLVKLVGAKAAVEICRDSEAAISEIKATMDAHNIDVEFRNDGWIWTATSEAQMGAWNSVVKACRKYALEPFKALPSTEVAARTGSRSHRAGVFEPTAATVHPARLARGLRKICLEKGVEIFENTKMLSFTRSAPCLVDTERGRITAKKLIICTNAWAADIRELSRSIVPITSDMIMTAPAKKALEKIGWTGGEGITDSQTMVDYYHVTKDHRVAFGKGGWGIAYGGNLGEDFDRNRERAKVVEADFRRYYSNLGDVEVTHDWCGPIDRTPNSLPLLGNLPGHSNIFYGVGWSGNGVCPSVLGGKILASLALGKKDKWGTYPLIEKSVGKFPPEPIRYVGAHVVRAAVARRERAEIEDKAPGWFSVQISKLAPAGLEDK